VVANLITAPESAAAAAPFRAWPSSQLIATMETNHHRGEIIAKPGAYAYTRVEFSLKKTRFLVHHNVLVYHQCH